MVRPLSSFFALYILTPGRRIFALGLMLDRVKALGLADLIEPIEHAIKHDRHALDLDAARLGKINLSAREYDQPVDRTLMIISQNLMHFAADEPLAAAMHANLFPIDVAHHTRLAFIEQASANERVLSILESETHEEWLDAHGQRPFIKQLREHHDKFAAVLKARGTATKVSWDEVKEAHTLGHELYLGVVARILVQFLGDPKLRDELLRPIFDQEQQVQIYRRQRRRIVDVNPETGEELPQPEGGGQPPSEG